jgi:hypothetical protein
LLSDIVLERFVRLTDDDSSFNSFRTIYGTFYKI